MVLAYRDVLLAYREVECTKAFHCVAPNHGAFFCMCRILRCGAVRCGADFRFVFESPSLRFGAVSSKGKRHSAVSSVKNVKKSQRTVRAPQQST